MFKKLGTKFQMFKNSIENLRKWDTLHKKQERKIPKTPKTPKTEVTITKKAKVPIFFDLQFCMTMPLCGL